MTRPPGVSGYTIKEPMRPGTIKDLMALMPRCQTCRHWNPIEDEPGMGECQQLHASDTYGGRLKIYPRARIGKHVVTPELFGCVQFGSKESV